MPVDSSLSEEFAPIPSWPKTIGIISICWGSLGLLCNGCGFAGIMMQGTFLKQAEEQFGPMPDVMKPQPAQMGLLAFGVLWTILLLISGILLVSRKQVSITLHLVYAVGGLIMGVVGTVVGVMQNLAISNWVQNNQSEKWAQQAKPTLGWVFLA